MGVLTDKQLQDGYFADIGGFPSAKIIHTVAEYDGSEQCCISCTQLQGRYTDSEGKRILEDWIYFLKDNPAAFRALHFNSYVPQALFDAICCQENLTELRLKRGNYSNFTGLTNLKYLQYLYLGSCPGVKDLTPITECRELVVLYIENFKQITDYSILQKLNRLEQLVISGPILADVPVADIDFIRNMPNLASVWFPNVRMIKRYSDDERENLRATDIRGVYNQRWWML
ncbi:MAG: hypothetical protein IKA47_08580 [Oscillospiraceae bacterium]|nr:hypothetical protein [Oscillospiraceae bacterium]